MRNIMPIKFWILVLAAVIANVVALVFCIKGFRECQRIHDAIEYNHYIEY
jgi:hypothetical protein